MDNIDKLAQKLAEMFKANQNRPSTAPRVGDVVETTPLKIQWGDQILLTEDKLLLPRGLVLEIGDQVVIQPDEFFKDFYVLHVLA
ncbi:DUF2577 family protein [Cohnella abietis]|nr:DUF2577 family protein [Cohnella abietis]